jgi:ribosomal protein L11 methylase PrmA
MPDQTVRVGKFKIRGVEQEQRQQEQGKEKDENIIFLQDIASGWGNGQHPTTKLCLNFISKNVKVGDVVLDYGTGSGILAILSKRLGAQKVYAVDIDEDSLRAAQKNVILNGYSCPSDIDVVHTKYVYIGSDQFAQQADITVANILPGPLSRLTSILWALTKPGPKGKLCLSGMRPHELPAIRRIYSPFVDLNTEEVEEMAHETYGSWVSWVCSFKEFTPEEKQAATDLLMEQAMG